MREKEQSRMTPTQVAGLENWKISWEVIKTVWKYLPFVRIQNKAAFLLLPRQLLVT